MPGMPTGGIVSIPNEFDLRRAESGSGEWLNFKVHYADRDYKGNSFLHMYKVSMWVPNTEINKCIEMIKPGKFFRITAHIDARIKDDYDPIPQLRVDYKYFISTKIGKIE